MYRVNSRLLHNHQEYTEGDTIELKEEYADPLLEAGTISRIEKKEEPEEEPESGEEESLENGMYYCPKCEHNHRVDSKIGKRHLKYMGD